jgi:hypothetical protein
MRQHYASVYPEPKFQAMDETTDKLEPDSLKVYKIKFSINLLTSVGEYYTNDPKDENKVICTNEGVDLMKIITESEEIEIFDC